MAHSFISDSKQDIEFARYLRALLEKEEFRVWVDEARLVPSTRWWQGIMTAACRAMTTYAFETLGLEYVEIRRAVANDRSRAIPQRLGFTMDGIVPQMDWALDRYMDTVVYRMSVIDW